MEDSVAEKAIQGVMSEVEGAETYTDIQETREVNKRIDHTPTHARSIKFTPSAVYEQLTPPIGLLAREGETETHKHYRAEAERVFHSSLSVSVPLDREMMGSFLRSGIEAVQEHIQRKGPYDNTEDGVPASSWMTHLREAAEVVAGTRKDPRSLHTVIDHVARQREKDAQSKVGDAGKNKIGISEEGALYRAHSFAYPESEKKVAQATVRLVREQNVAVRDWVTKNFGAPKDSWT